MSDDAWAFVTPYVPLMTEEAPQRAHSVRAVLNIVGSCLAPIQCALRQGTVPSNVKEAGHSQSRVCNCTMGTISLENPSTARKPSVTYGSPVKLCRGASRAADCGPRTYPSCVMRWESSKLCTR